MQPAILAIVFGFFAWMLYIGWKTHAGRSVHDQDENFLIGNRSISGWLVAIGTTMGWVDAFQFSVTPGIAFDQGWDCLWYFGGVTFSFLFLMIFAGKLRRNAASDGAYMMGNYFSRIYSPRVAAIIGAVMTIYFFIWLSVQFSVGGQVLAGVTHLPAAPIMIAMGVVALAYMLMGGFLASIRTDLIQFFIVLAFVAGILALWGPKIGAWLPARSTWGSQPIMSSITLFTLNLASTIAAPDVWQRIYSARSDGQARKSMGILAVLMTSILLFFASLGLMVKSVHPDGDSQTMATDIFAYLVPDWLLPLAVLTFMAAVMSTVATCVFGTAMTITSDIAAELRLVKPERLPAICRRLMGAVMIIAISLAFMNIDLMTLAFTTLAVTEVALPLVLLSMFGVRISERAAFWGMGISFAAFFIGAYYGIYTGPLGLLPLGVAAAVTGLIEAGVRVTARKPAPAQP